MRLSPPKCREQELCQLFLFGEITDDRAGMLVMEIERARKAGQRVRVWVSSLGGDLGGALALHDALQRSPGAEAIATGHCLSAALIVFLGAETRWCTPNTIFLNHAITGGDGQIWPLEVGLPILERLGAIRAGSFGPELARDMGLVATFAEVKDGGEVRERKKCQEP